MQKRSLWYSLGATLGGGALLWAALCALFFLKDWSCAQETPAAAQPELAKIVLNVGKAHIDAEVAHTPQQLAAGLMYRPTLSDNAGMIFVLGKPKHAVFWMENTSIPLSIAFLDRGGRILEIYDMRPFDRKTVESQSDRVAYAIEVNQGWFQLNGVVPGTDVKPVGAYFGKPPLALTAP
ncbi:MAG: DUF192 domain-containing protein [Verrucomicrobium sp.]|nr:DUF192 domain-containing protein [Verrucomicrobium sp.]